MKKEVIVADGYKDDSCVEHYISHLPSSFEQGGAMLWDGRNKVKAFTMASGKEIVVKRFKKLMIVQKIGYLFRTHKAIKAFANGCELVRRGIDTPQPIACIMHYQHKLVADAYYICERNDLPPIEDLLYRDDWDEELATAFGHFVVTLHRHGVLHHDLNDTNVRFARNENGEYVFSLIDINRMSFYDRIEDVPMRERIENITRFTNRIKLFELVARIYAREFGLDIDQWLPQAIEQKQRHDRNRRWRKRMVHPFRHK